MSPNPKRDYDLAQILDLMKANKVTKVKLGSLEVEMHPSAFEQPSSDDVAPKSQPIGTELNPTEDQLLYWSSGYDPEVSTPEDGSAA